MSGGEFFLDGIQKIKAADPSQKHVHDKDGDTDVSPLAVTHGFVGVIERNDFAPGVETLDNCLNQLANAGIIVYNDYIKTF